MINNVPVKFQTCHGEGDRIGRITVEIKIDPNRTSYHFIYYRNALMHISMGKSTLNNYMAIKLYKSIHLYNSIRSSRINKNYLIKGYSRKEN